MIRAVNRVCRRLACSIALVILAAGIAPAQDDPDHAALIARARVWTPVDIAARDLRAGPTGPGAFAPGETVRCDYLDKDLDGASLKFACRLAGDDEVKVKF